MGQLQDVLKNVSAQEFKDKFGIEKPALHQEVIFSCKMGGRALKAATAAAAIGFEKYLHIRNIVPLINK